MDLSGLQEEYGRGSSVFLSPWGERDDSRALFFPSLPRCLQNKDQRKRERPGENETGLGSSCERVRESCGWGGIDEGAHAREKAMHARMQRLAGWVGGTDGVVELLLDNRREKERQESKERLDFFFSQTDGWVSLFFVRRRTTGDTSRLRVVWKPRCVSGPCQSSDLLFHRSSFSPYLSASCPSLLLSFSLFEFFFLPSANFAFLLLPLFFRPMKDQ